MALNAYFAFYVSFSLLLISNQRQVHLIDESRGLKPVKNQDPGYFLWSHNFQMSKTEQEIKNGKSNFSKRCFTRKIRKKCDTKKLQLHKEQENILPTFTQLKKKKERISHSNNWFCNWNGHEAFNICFILFNHVKTLLTLCLVAATAQVQKQRSF